MAICNRLRDLQNEIVTPRKRTSCPAKLEFVVPKEIVIANQSADWCGNPQRF